MKGRQIFLYSVLLLVLASAVYFRLNAGSIYASIGDFYYKHDNSAKAQNFYEKSISSGNNDSKFREKYVNSLINSPLTIEAQERLVKFAEDNIHDSASSNAEYFLYNLKREIHNKYPENYVKSAPYNNKIVHWGKLPITYTFKNTRYIPEEFINEVNNAFDEWERVSSCRIKFERVKYGNADIIVDFRPNNIKDAEHGVKYVIASTLPEINQDRLIGMEIKFNTQDPDGKDFTPNQIYNTALHEVFHALGFMGHSTDKDNIMFMAKSNDTVLKDERLQLNEADKSTLELLYKIKPDITNAEELEYSYVPYLILGDDEEISSLKFKEAKNYIYHAPSLPNGYIDMAEAYAQKGEYTRAIRNLETALRLSKDAQTRYMVYYNLAVSYFYQSHYDMTEEYIEYAQKINDTNELHHIKAQVYLKTGKMEDAEKEYIYLIKKEPDNMDYTLALANIYVKQRAYIKAREVLKDFLKNNPSEKDNQRLKPYGILIL